MILLHTLALFCGIFSVNLGWTHPASVASPNMQAEIMKLKEHFSDYSKKNKSKWYDHALFLQRPNIFDSKLKGGDKKLVIAEMLRVSQTMLSNLLAHTTEEDMRMSILAIKGRLEDRQKDFPAMDQAVQERLQALWAIKTDDFMTQLQALRELMEVYSRASNLSNQINERMEKRRRRRQIHQSKTT